VFDLEQLGNTSITGQLTKQPMDKLIYWYIPDLVAEEHLLQVSEAFAYIKKTNTLE
jgi:hypothetical protein